MLSKAKYKKIKQNGQLATKWEEIKWIFFYKKCGKFVNYSNYLNNFDPFDVLGVIEVISSQKFILRSSWPHWLTDEPTKIDLLLQLGLRAIILFNRSYLLFHAKSHLCKVRNYKTHISLLSKDPYIFYFFLTLWT